MKKKAENLGSNQDSSLDDFKILRVIGKGAYGKVFLVKHRGDDKTLYAMKAMRKDRIIENGVLEKTMNEIKIMQ